ncbi:hypothetical protein B0H11DRAFT_2266100 [Mycena galericulata]|nr:hypothetical protein B0H11DRAFT_2266100 [Mycena galericulata]
MPGFTRRDAPLSAIPQPWTPPTLTGVGGPVAELARGFSWVLVKWKSHSDGAQHSGVTLVLYEEFVPRKYRLAFAGAAPLGTK